MLTTESPLKKAIEAITISDAGFRLGLPGTLKKSCCVPWRDDKHPSLSIFDNDRMFKDHARGETGNVVKFVSRAASLSMSDAAKLLINWNGGVAACLPSRSLKRRSRGLQRSLDRDSITKSVEPRESLRIPGIDKGSIEELTLLKRSRGLPLFAALELLYSRGMFGFCNHDGSRCWILTDPAAKNAQVRPLKPEKAKWRMKGKSLYGSDSSWPVGAVCNDNTHIVLLTEGPPDLLAVATAAWLELDGRGFERIGFCCMTGATANISRDALHLFADKRVRIFVHSDDAGKKARDQWAEQLGSVVSYIDQWHSERDGEDFNDWASRQWLNSEDGLSLPENLIPQPQ